MSVIARLALDVLEGIAGGAVGAVAYLWWRDRGLRRSRRQERRDRAEAMAMLDTLMGHVKRRELEATESEGGN